MAGITQEAAEKILEADFTNIVRKVRDGKTLTSTERARVQARAAGSSATLTEAKTIVELASALGVTRRTLSNWRKMKGAPEPNPNGSHNVSAWRDFVQANELKGHVDGGGAETEALKASKLLAEVEERELKVAVKKGEYILLEDVRKGWHTLVGKAIALLRAKFENELPPILSGLDAQGIREENSKAIDEVCRLLHTSKSGLTS